jgi:RNA polymerase sigma factor (sigma-70 family)
MTVDDLADLVERAQRGDGNSVEAVLVAVGDDVHRLALRMTGCPDDALDATQEILVKVLTRMSTFNGEAAFSTWVHRVAVNHLLTASAARSSGSSSPSAPSRTTSTTDSRPSHPTPAPSSTCWRGRSNTAAPLPC